MTSHPLLAAELEPIQDLPALTEFPARLSEEPSSAIPTDESIPLVQPKALSSEETKALLGRLPPLPTLEDAKPFALRPSSEPPPKVGETLQQAFPPPPSTTSAPTTAKSGPLTVTRYAPQGEVPAAQQISISFDRPMVALSTHSQTVAESLPVTMTPAVDGAWRWAGTQTLIFEPKEGARLPMATEFNLSVPAETQAADGTRLAKDLAWSFKTPTLKLEQSYPSGDSVELTPTLFLSFNQRIDPQTLLPFIQAQAQAKPLKLRLAAADEIKSGTELDGLVKNAKPNHYLVLKLEQPLPPSTKVTLKLAAQAPSAEGKRLAPAQNLSSFSTYAPLRVLEKACGYEDRCTRYDPITVQFNNALAPAQELEKLIEISPKPTQFRVEANGNGLWIQSTWQADTTYTISLPAGLRDSYGQTLGKPQSFSFKISKSPASLSIINKILLTLDPNLPAALAFYTNNFKTAKVTIQQVEPSDWPAYFNLLRDFNNRQAKAPVKLPGKTVSTQQVNIKDQTDTLVSTPIELAPWLKGGKLGHLLVLIEPGEASIKPRAIDGEPQPRLVWVQGTQIGLDAYADSQQLLAWAGDLNTGKALDKVNLSLHSSVSKATSQQAADAQGLAKLNYLNSPQNPASVLPLTSNEPAIHWLQAQQGEDIALLPETEYAWAANVWQAAPLTKQWLWYVLDDRHLYRPNEQVHLKGWLRTRDSSPASPLSLAKDLTSLNYEVLDSAGNKLAEGSTALTGLGGFNLDFKLPDTPNLGSATVNFTVANQAEPIVYSHNFEIQEFRTPEFEVKTELTKPEPYVGNAAIQLVTSANYYSGGGLATAPVNWHLNASPQAYTPPNRDEWSFGLVQPYWMRWWMPPVATVSADFQSKTDAEGRQQLLIQPELSKYPLPLSMTAEARISDVNRQEWVASSTWLIHPATTYVGLKTESQFVEQNQPLGVQILTTDIEGKELANTPVILEAKLDEGSQNSTEAAAKQPQRCTVQTDAKGLAQCEFKLAEAGQYLITATTLDPTGRQNMTRISRWVSGDTEVEPVTASTVQAQQLQIIADKETYAPTETAKLLIQAPFKDTEGLLLVNHNGLVAEQRFSISGNSKILELALKSEWLPNVQVYIELTGKTARFTKDKTQSLPEQPAFATGNLSLKLSKAERTLKVEVTPEKPLLAPAEETAIHLSLQNQQGQPVANAEVALIVVDEAILTAGNYKLADPLDIFYPSVEAYIQAQSLRSSIVVPSLTELSDEQVEVMKAETANMGGGMAAAAAPIAQARPRPRSPIVAEGKMSRFMAADAAASPEPNANAAINLRSNFNPLAAFVPNLQTDANGKVSTTLKLPDNLTRYRIMAVAAQEAIYYGKGEAHLTARKPLMVRPSAPRFLNYGDSFEFPVVLQNQTDQALPVQVALAASNLELTSAQGYSFELPANQRVEVRFPAKTVKAGEVHYQIAAAANDLSDAANGSLPVWTPATSEAFATYGVLDQGAISQPLETPKTVIPEFGQLQITTSSTALQSLTDAYIYLQDYPFSCSEQVASRILSTSALKDVLQAFKTKDLPSPEAIQQSMQRDIALLLERQTGDGGFSLWDRGQTWPYVTAHTVHALLRAKAKGYAVNEPALEAGLNYLRELDQHWPNDYSKEVRQYIKAYSLYVRQVAGDQDTKAAATLITQAGGVSKLPSESLGWLLSVLATDNSATQQRQAILKELMNRTTETASGASIKNELNAGGYWVMHSERAANGIVLEALIKSQPKSDLIPKLVKNLQARRTKGHWGSTQDNVFVLLGLDQYFQTYEAQTPDFVAKAWLGADFAGEYSFKGRSTDSQETEIPMEWLLKGEARRDLVLAKQGEGRLYYRLGLNYAPQNLELAAAEHGFTVSRSYRGLDKPEDVKQTADGAWQIKAGARVEVTLTMQANAERYHVALVDPLPAGLEAVNPALAVSAQLRPEEPEPVAYSWLGAWYEQQNLRDERVEAFTSVLPEGVYTYRYIAKATTPGSFIVPPVKAEEMYAPETFGRSASTKVVIE